MRHITVVATVWLISCFVWATARVGNLAAANQLSPLPAVELAIADDLPGMVEPCACDEPTNCDCGACCCGTCCNLCPCHYAWAEGLILGRNNRGADRPLVLNLNTNDVLLSVGDLDFDWAGGVRAGYGVRLWDCWSVEFGYLGVFDQTASALIVLEDSLTLPDDLGLQVNNFFGADSVSAVYGSEIHSAEVNLVHCCCWCDCGGICSSIEWLGGFRFIDLEEDFTLSAFDSAEGTTDYSVRTRNHLYGGQLGARFRRSYGEWSWEATGKSGLYGNDMEQIQDPIIDFPGFVFRDAQGSHGSDVAFVGDLNLTGIYQLNQVWGLRTGYNLIWIEGVALAPDQLDFTNTPTSGQTLVGGGGVFLHGVSAGLEARW